MSSRFLSYVLRHHPETIGIALDRAGWVDVETLLTAMAAHGRAMDLATLQRIVTDNDKQRFELRDGRIRAVQGHSVPVDLQLAAVRPPPVLYHGTVQRFLARIQAEGLRPKGRTHVHLSPDAATARAVGARRGSPVILTIDAAGMHRHGQKFYVAANGVWLTAHVPPEWIAPQ